MPTKFKWFNKERAAIAGASAVFILFNWILWDPHLFNMIFNDAENRGADAQKVGDIVEANHDARLKSQRSMNWRSVDHSEAIYSGDSVFTGEKSNVSVTMNDGGRLELGENTMIFFKNVKGIQIPTLAQGNFKISVAGKMKVSINNQITEVNGRNSEIEMVVKKGRKPQVKLIRGTAEIKLAKREAPILLSKASVANVTLPIVPPPPRPKQSAAKALISVAAPPVDTIDDLDVPDLPEDAQVKAASESIASPEPPEPPVEKPTVMNAPPEPERTVASEPAPSVVAAAPTPEPTPAPTPVPEPTPKLAADPTQVLRSFAGPTTYDYVQKLYDVYDVNGFNLAPKRASGYSVNLPIKLGWETVSPADGQVAIEYSQTPDFANAKKYPNPANPLVINSAHEGANYWRLSLDDRPSLQTNTFFVNARPLASKPDLSWDQRRLMLTGATVEAHGHIHSGLGRNVGGYVIESSTRSDFASGTKIYWSNSADLTLHLTTPGVYYIRARATNQQTEISQFSETSQLFVERPVPVRLTKAAPPPPASLPRKVAAEPSPAPSATSGGDSGSQGQITAAMPKDDYVIPNYLNRNYSSSRFNFDVTSFDLLSGEQLQASNGASAIGSSVRIGVRNWLGGGNNGYDASGLMTVLGNGLAKPMDIEASYLHRWFFRWNPFSDYNETQISWLLGLEYYKNSGTGIFAQNYNLAKTGLLFDFPLLHRLSTGGELIYGYWMDQSEKYEVNGFLNYIFQTKWSLGGGYRLNLFQAGTQTQPPKTAAPYREAYGEFYSTLQYHY